MVDSKAPSTKHQAASTSPALLVVVGPTASGKSALALQLAQKFNGEIVCADSRTVYKGMDIGTAKPSIQDRELVPHHLLDVVSLDEPFTVADFKTLANAAINDIHKRGKLPILVGGSGLYIDSVLFDYQFSESGASRDPDNPRHLDKSVARSRKAISPDVLVIGLQIPRDILKERITTRVDNMVKQGFLSEVEQLNKQYSGSKALDAPGYKAFLRYVNGEISLDEAKALFIKNDMNLAKRQMTWFKRNESIQWLGDPKCYVADVTTLLNKKQ